MYECMSLQEAYHSRMQQLANSRGIRKCVSNQHKSTTQDPSVSNSDTADNPSSSAAASSAAGSSYPKAGSSSCSAAKPYSPTSPAYTPSASLPAAFSVSSQGGGGPMTATGGNSTSTSATLSSALPKGQPPTSQSRIGQGSGPANTTEPEKDVNAPCFRKWMQWMQRGMIQTAAAPLHAYDSYAFILQEAFVRSTHASALMGE